MKKATPDFHWTDEAIATLTRLDAEGRPFSQIGAALGISRNAAIGKARRIGLPPRTAENCVVNWRSAKLSRAGKSGKGSRPQPRTRRFTDDGKRMVETNEVEAINIFAPEYSPLAVAFIQLEPQHCRWPVNSDQPGYWSCGAKHIDGCSYCARHARIAYQAPRDRRHVWVPKRGEAA